MKEIYNTLSQLQDVLAKMFEIEDEIKEIPMALEDKEAVLQKTKITYLELHEKSEKVKDELKNLRFKLDEAEKMRETSEKKMETITQAREFENVQKEINEAKEAEQNLRKSLLAKERFFEELNDKLTIQEEIMSAQSEEVEEETAVKDKIISEKQAILNEVAKQKEILTKDFDMGLLFKFERIIRNKKGLGIVPVHGNVCEGCHMVLPVQFVNDVRKATDNESESSEDSIKFCPYCSRILFYEESDENQDLTTISDSSDDSDALSLKSDSDDDFLGETN